MWIGRDLTTKCVNKYTWVYLVSSQSGFSPNKLLMIGINLNEEGGPTAAPITFNVDMNKHILNGEFNPGSDFVDVAGTFNDWGGSEALSDDDGDGIYTITIPDFTIGSEIEFKYRINANWDTSEFPFGGPNREYTVRYWNDLNHVYNGGETTGIETVQTEVSTIVYPNPNDGKFVIEINLDKTDNLNISLSNAIGKTVYTNKISNSLAHIEQIDLELPSGLYFLVIENSQQKTVRKIIVR